MVRESPMTAIPASTTKSSIATSLRVSGSSGILEKLRQAPSREGEDCDETHPAVSSLSRMRDAHGSDSPGDQQQRSSRYGGVVRPLDTPADPVSRDQQDAHSDGGYAKR